MEKITKDVIQDKAVIRKLHILESLSESNSFISSEVLADQLKCTKRTIINDISQLKLTLPNNWELISISSKGHLLKKDPLDKLSNIISPYLINSDIFKILLGIFNHKYYTLEKWSQLLYINKFTLKKNLNEFTRTLNHFDLDFNFKTLQLIGDELKIRYFYIVFFYTIQKYTEIIDIHPYLQKKIEHITRLYEVELDFNLLTIIINVSVNRIMHKCFISKNFHFKSTFNQKKLKCIESIIVEIEKSYKIKLLKKEQLFIILSLFLISEGDNEEKKDITNYYHKSQEEIYNKYLCMLDIISSEFNLNLKVKEKIQYNIYFYLYKIDILKHNNLSIEYLLGQYKNLHKETQELIEGYNIIHPLITSWNKNLAKNILTKNEIYIITFNILFTLHLNSQKKALLLLSGPTAWKEFIYCKLNNELGNVLILHSKINNAKKYDVIITNYNININIKNLKTPVIQISDSMNQIDLNRIRQFVYLNNK
ncbi:helix-turn-helix domain containing protein [Brevibacterium sp. JNUCC-42]|nr:helix-turn-helix domain containing protein [Brevibacterium sp. JNUCC-42]